LTFSALVIDIRYFVSINNYYIFSVMFMMFTMLRCLYLSTNCFGVYLVATFDIIYCMLLCILLCISMLFSILGQPSFDCMSIVDFIPNLGFIPAL